MKAVPTSSPARGILVSMASVLLLATLCLQILKVIVLVTVLVMVSAVIISNAFVTLHTSRMIAAVVSFTNKIIRDMSNDVVL